MDDTELSVATSHFYIQHKARIRAPESAHPSTNFYFVCFCLLSEAVKIMRLKVLFGTKASYTDVVVQKNLGQ